MWHDDPDIIPKGKWKYERRSIHVYQVICPVCDYSFMSSEYEGFIDSVYFNYCPNCGEHMNTQENRAGNPFKPFPPKEKKMKHYYNRKTKQLKSEQIKAELLKIAKLKLETREDIVLFRDKVEEIVIGLNDYLIAQKRGEL